MNIATRDLVTAVYNELIDHGRMPTAAAIGERLGVTRSDVIDALRSANLGKTLLADPGTGELWMVGPFSARETPYRVTAGERSWWANCAWDMLGIAALVDVPVRIEAQCSDCGETLTTRLAPNEARIADWIVHFLLPARRWYDDIGYT